MTWTQGWLPDNGIRGWQPKQKKPKLFQGRVDWLETRKSELYKIERPPWAVPMVAFYYLDV